MSPERAEIESAVAALRAQRAVLGDALIDAALAPLLARLAALNAEVRERVRNTVPWHRDVVEALAQSNAAA